MKPERGCPAVLPPHASPPLCCPWGVLFSWAGGVFAARGGWVGAAFLPAGFVVGPAGPAVLPRWGRPGRPAGRGGALRRALRVAGLRHRVGVGQEVDVARGRT